MAVIMKNNEDFVSFFLKFILSCLILMYIVHFWPAVHGAPMLFVMCTICLVLFKVRLIRRIFIFIVLKVLRESQIAILKCTDMLRKYVHSSALKPYLFYHTFLFFQKSQLFGVFFGPLFCRFVERISIVLELLSNFSF